MKRFELIMLSCALIGVGCGDDTAQTDAGAGTTSGGDDAAVVTPDSDAPEGDEGAADDIEAPEQDTAAQPPTLAWRTVESPVQSDLTDVWGESKDAIWATGLGGKILQYDGVEWVSLPTGTDVDFYAIWGSGSQLVWVTGAGGTVFFFDGETWAAENTGLGGDLHGVCGTTKDDVWVVGHDGEIGHFDGAKWAKKPSAPADLNDIWMLENSFGFMVGGDAGGKPLLMERTGETTFGPVDLGQLVAEGDSLVGTGGSAEDRFFAHGNTAQGAGLLLELDGTAWSTVEGLDDYAVLGIWGSGAQRTWLATGSDQVLSIADGKVEAVSADKPLVGGLTAVFGFAEDNVWAVGPGGTLIHYSN